MSGAAHGVLAVVIARAGSKGLPGKNALLVANRPMISHTVEHALNASSVSRVVVSTDGNAIAEAARAMQVPVIMRPAELADDHATVDAAVRHAVLKVENGDAAARCKVVVILYGNVPVRPPGLIDRAVTTLIESRADSVQSYGDVGKHHPFWMITLDEHQRVQPHHANAVYRRQDLPRLFLPDGGVIAVTRDSLFCDDAVSARHPHAFLGRDRRGIEVPPGQVVDVDTAVDLAVAEAVLQAGQLEDQSIMGDRRTG